MTILCELSRVSVDEHLVEIQRCRQVPGEPRRRWFSSSEIDSIVWFDEGNDVSGFQLCYKDVKSAKVITWHKGAGYLNSLVDNGEGFRGCAKMSPVLLPDGRFKQGEVISLFDNQSYTIDATIADLVRHRLLKYCCLENE